jgi:UDP-N-acetylmuramoyl-L-alanyl-D-glutamate--2,6-diaminopimelate ligase
VEALLTVMRDVTQGSLVVVLGCGGDRDRGKRRLMGSAAARLADVAILTNDNPRSEDPLAILAEMMAGAIEVPQKERAQVVVQPDRAAAISLAIASAGKGDVVIIAGKGHEHGQYIGGAVIPFDDREVAAEALLHRRAGEDATMAGGLAAGGWSAPGGNPPGAASKGAEDLNEPYPEDA